MAKADEAPKEIEFMAQLSQGPSAIAFDSVGGAKIRLDVSLSDASKVLMLQHFFSGNPFRVKIISTD